MKYQKIIGVIVPLLTALKDDALDFDGYAALIDFVIDRGVAGLFPLGTTGEGPLMTNDERRQIAEWTVKCAAGRVPVIIHSGTISTNETIALTRHARDVGASAAAIIPPYFYRLSDAALYDHFAAVAKAVPDFPLYLYNNPGVTPNIISVDLVIRLAETFPNYVGLKDSSGALGALFASRSLQNDAFNAASGSDSLVLASQAIGADACISGNANFVPELVVGTFDAARRGDLDAARKLQALLDEVRFLLGDGSDLSLFKAMCAQRGVSIGDVRAPLRKASAEKISACWERLVELAPFPISS